MLLLVAAVAQGLDAITMGFDREINPVVLALGPTAYLAKIALILGVTALAWALPRLSTSTLLMARRRTSFGMAILSLAVGLLGFASNTIWPIIR